MQKFGIALMSTLLAALLLVPPFALGETAKEKKTKDCNEQANPKSVGIGIFGIGIGQIGIGQGKSDERKASAKECSSAKQVKSGKTAQQNKCRYSIKMETLLSSASR